jgi:hypothetical protein
MKRIFIIAALTASVNYVFAQIHTKQPDTSYKKLVNVNSPTAFRMKYDDLFKRNADASISPILPIQINGEMISTSTRISTGIAYGGVKLGEYTGHDMMVDTVRGVVIIRKIL